MDNYSTADQLVDALTELDAACERVELILRDAPEAEVLWLMAGIVFMAEQKRKPRIMPDAKLLGALQQDIRTQMKLSEWFEEEE